MPWLAAALTLLAVAAAWWAVRRRARPGVPPPPVAAVNVPSAERGGDGLLHAQALLALLSPTTRLPDGWAERADVAASVAVPDAEASVGQAVWDRTAVRLGVSELVAPDSAYADPVADDELFATTGDPRRRRGSLRVRRRLANLPAGDDVELVEAAPQYKPWSVRGGYADVDWRALDLPEPIPDDFVR